MSAFILTWIATMAPLVVSPGPANILLANSGLHQGLRGSLGVLIGIDLVFVIKSTLIGFGLNLFFLENSLAIKVLSISGSLYLIYLALIMLKQKNIDGNQTNQHLGFKEGLIAQVLNPKGG